MYDADAQWYSNDAKIESALETIELILDESHGEPTMSPDHVKHSVLLLKRVLEAQQSQINALAMVALAPKRTFIQRLLRK